MTGMPINVFQYRTTAIIFFVFLEVFFSSIHTANIATIAAIVTIAIIVTIATIATIINLILYHKFR